MKFISYQERRNKYNQLVRRYKVYNFGLFKIKKKVLPVLGDNNKIIIAGRELTENDKKFLDSFGKIRIVGNNNIFELADTSNLKIGIRIEGNGNKIRVGKFSSLTHVEVAMPRWYNNNRELIINDSQY